MKNDNKIEFLSELTSALGLTLLVVDREGKCILSNWSLSSTLGEAPSNLETLVGLMSDSPKKQSEFLAHFSDIQHKKAFSFSFVKKDSYDVKRYYKVNTAMLKNVSDAPIAIQITETTEIHNLFAEVESLTRQASAGRIAAGVAHEFNNILTAMLGWTQLAVRSAENDTVVSALETIDNNTRRAKQIASELLDITKPQSEEQASKPVSVNQLVEEALKLLSWEINSAHITVNKDLQPTSMCDGDGTRLVQVFINVIRNALDATPSHGTLDVGVSQEADTVHVTFKDNGHGIPEDILNNIFTPFFTTKTKGSAKVHGGSGLGLSISKKIIQEFGGDILVSSRRPGGTTVTIELPCTENREPQIPETPRTNSSFPPGIAVLVVDDEPDICEMIRTALSLRGAHVVVATNGKDALNLCHKEMFNAAFLDFSMSGLSGHELGNAIAEVQPNLPIVFMSGVEVPPNDNPVYSDFLKKPFDLHEIQCKLREILEK